MFTDIVGFTALAQSSERDAMRSLEWHNELLRPFFARFRGREVKTMGDSFLVEFESALEATTCALEIQRALETVEPSIPGRPRLRLRIGIHLGDVIESGGDVLGDAVNIASRIEPLAEPGGICVTAQVADQVRNKVEAAFVRLEGPQLKNVQASIGVYRIVPSGQPQAEASTTTEPSPHRRLAVLPFTNMSPDPQDEFFADGLTEEIITELSRIPSLQVIARTSVMRYKNTSKTVREIGNELRVSDVMEGSVRKAGNRIRITAQLIDVGSEAHVWAERFDRELADIFAVQGDIASSVAKAFDLRFQPPSMPTRPSPQRVEAYTLYLRGRFLWNQRTVATVWEALHRFEEAVAIDPTFPLAYSGIADCYSILIDRRRIASSDALPKSRAAAEQGLRLDPRSAEAHASLGLVLTHSGDFTGAERELRAAISLRPGYAAAHHWLYLDLLSVGRAEEAGVEIAKAEESDPMSSAVLSMGAFQAWITGRNEEALRKWDWTLELNPVSDGATIHQISLLVLTGRREEAVRRLEAYRSGPADLLARLWVSCLCHALLGDRPQTEKDLSELAATPGGEFLSESVQPMTAALLGDLDRAYGILLGDPSAPDSFQRASFRYSPTLEAFRADPRFNELIRRWESALPPAA